MAKRGRPPYPDLLTPREQEVLEHLRARRSNPEIAGRLGISVEGVKYHVSEILSKLGVASREEAARWRGEERRWWLTAVAPAGWLWRRAGSSAVSVAATGVLFAGAIGGLALLAFFLARSGGAGTYVPDGPRLAFSAGGSIYTVRPDGSDLREIVHGDLGADRNGAPAISPDGTRIVFVRSYDIWTAGADGRDVHRLADVAPPPVTPPGADDLSLGAQSLSWSPDGKHIAYVMARIGGSGIQDVWVMDADGQDRLSVYTTGSFVRPTWLDNDQLAAYDSSRIHLFDISGAEETALPLTLEARPALVAASATSNTQPVAGAWLIGPFTGEGGITLGTIGQANNVAEGIAPTLSSDGASFAYFQGDSLRITSVAGTGDREAVDLTPLGGRDRFFAEQPECLPDTSPACSYLPPLVSWSAGPSDGTTTPDGAVQFVSTPTPEASTRWQAFWQVDDQTGWIAGSLCVQAIETPECEGLIYKTTDGAAAWQEQYRGNEMVHQLQFVDPQHGWAVAAKGKCIERGNCPSVLLRTSDGGGNWNEAYSSPIGLLEVSFSNASDGWMLASPSACAEPCFTLYSTRDGGETWTETGLPLTGSFAGLSRPAADDAWIMSDEKDGMAIAATHDDGQSWNRLPLREPVPHNPNIGGTMFFLNSTLGWLLLGGQPGAGSQAKELFGTTDGGETWSHLAGSLSDPTATGAPQDGLGRPGYVSQVLFTSETDGWIALQRLGLLHTSDGGNTWNLALNNAASSLWPVRFVDANHGWTMDGVTLYATSDGGETWTSLPLPQLSQ